MPIYEYRCNSCGHTLDALQKVSDPPLAECPACEESALKRLISAPAFRLKGSGWYETDFKSDKERKRNLAEGAGEASGGEKKDGEKKDGDKSSSAAEKKQDTKPSKDSKDSNASTKSKGSGSEAA